mmetsp:Transcript_55461/g.179869  ORF Transcript_55461/g.179869 Transcript_55461/m.179869 type:complete len:306 (+) Transcript_55461:655-1572(+)
MATGSAKPVMMRFSSNRFKPRACPWGTDGIMICTSGPAPATAGAGCACIIMGGPGITGCITGPPIAAWLRVGRWYCPVCGARRPSSPAGPPCTCSKPSAPRPPKRRAGSAKGECPITSFFWLTSGRPFSKSTVMQIAPTANMKPRIGSTTNMAPPPLLALDVHVRAPAEAVPAATLPPCASTAAPAPALWEACTSDTATLSAVPLARPRCCTSSAVAAANTPADEPIDARPVCSRCTEAPVPSPSQLTAARRAASLEISPTPDTNSKKMEMGLRPSQDAVCSMATRMRRVQYQGEDSQGVSALVA